VPLCTSNQHPHVLQADGPRLQVAVHLAASVAKLRGTQATFRGIGLIDTGAGGTCISRRTAQALSLKPVAVCPVSSPTGVAQKPVYIVDFEFPGSQIRITNVQVIEADVDGQGIDMLIGRDVLAHCGFIYDGPVGRWILEFPRDGSSVLQLNAPASTPALSPPSPPTPEEQARQRTERNRKKAARKQQQRSRKGK